MRVSIVSDTICPWCYIGKRRFERARAGRPAELAVEWRPFQLNPDMPADGVDRQRYMVAKFGSEERVSEIFGAIEQAGEAEGIQFVFDRNRAHAQHGRFAPADRVRRAARRAGSGGRGPCSAVTSSRARTSATVPSSPRPGSMAASTRRNCRTSWPAPTEPRTCAGRARPRAAWAYPACPASSSRASTPFRARNRRMSSNGCSS